MSERGEIREPWRSVLSAAGLSDARMLLRESPQGELAGRWELLSKPGLVGRQRWRWTFDRAGSDEVVYVKRYTRPPPRQQWDRIRRQTPSHSTAWWECCCSRMLMDAGVAAVEAIGFAERMRGPYEQSSAVLLRQVPGDAFDRSWQAAEGRGDSFTRGAERHAATRQIARFAARFHNTGFRHRDFYLCHIFAAGGPDPSTGDLELRLIDLARVFRPRRRSERWRVKDLSQLDASARQIGASWADRFRFLRGYCAVIQNAPRLDTTERAVGDRSHDHQQRPVGDRFYDQGRGGPGAGRSFDGLAARVKAKSDRILARIARKSSA